MRTRLLHVTTGQPVVTFDENSHPVFARPHLARFFEIAGIRIPPVPEVQALFPNKKVVRLDDPDFMRAFVEVYCKFYLQDFNGEYRLEH